MFNRRARSLLTNTACDRVQNRFNYSVSCIYGTIFDPLDDWGQSLFKGRGVVSFSVQNPSASENSPHFHPSTSLGVTKSFHPGTSLEAYLFLGASLGRLEVFTPLDVKIFSQTFFFAKKKRNGGCVSQDDDIHPLTKILETWKWFNL